MREKIMALIADETGKEITAETKTDALGLDSLEFIDLLLRIQEFTGIEIPDAVISHIESVGDIFRAVEGTLVTI